jgi:hypothetical protein
LVRELQSLSIITPSFVLTLTWEICVGFQIRKEEEEEEEEEEYHDFRGSKNGFF